MLDDDNGVLFEKATRYLRGFVFGGATAVQPEGGSGFLPCSLTATLAYVVADLDDAACGNVTCGDSGRLGAVPARWGRGFDVGWWPGPCSGIGRSGARRRRRLRRVFRCPPPR